MKVGILTASRTNNIGTDIQTYAMYRLFESKNINIEIINYKCRELEKNNVIIERQGVKSIFRIPYKLKDSYNHSYFRHNYFKHSSKVYDKKNVSEILEDYDIVIVGSDQIWNLDMTQDVNFFLPFKEGHARKYSYAASLGKDNVTDWEQNFHISSYLEDFAEVSVREISAVPALTQIGISAEQNLDPLLMLQKEDWEIIASKKKSSEKYIFLYLIEPNKKAMNFGRKLAAEMGCRVRMSTVSLKKYFGISVTRYPSISQWIRSMLDADIIVTNSYHGLSMAIALRKNFRAVRLRKDEQNTRMMSLLKMIGHENFMEQYDGQLSPDWNLIDDKLENEKDKSQLYIKRILESSLK